MTYTLVVMEIPQDVYDLLKEKLDVAGYQHAIDEDEGILDMTGIGLVVDKDGAVAERWTRHQTTTTLARYAV